MIKEFFSNKTVLGRELAIYKSLYETVDLEAYDAEKLILESKKQYKEINKEEIFNEQSKLIKKINQSTEFDIFSNFVPNYKSLATVYQIFNDDLTPKKRVLLEKTLLSRLTSSNHIKSDTDVPKIDNVVVKAFTKKFNDKYDSFLAEQKNLLNNYILSFSDEGLELKIYLNEELGRLKKTILEKSESKQDRQVYDFFNNEGTKIGLRNGR